MRREGRSSRGKKGESVGREATSRADSQRQAATAESRASRTARGQRFVDCCRAAAALQETPKMAASVRRMRARASGCSCSASPTRVDGDEDGFRR